MLTPALDAPSSTDDLIGIGRRRWTAWCTFVTIVVLGVAVVDRITPNPSYLATVLLLAALLAALARPLVGLHVVVFGTLFSDIRVVPWYPFVKNFSSEESLLYLADGAIVNPLELVLLATLVGWWVRTRFEGVPVRAGRLTVPLGVLGAAVVLGFVNGMAQGGDLRIGLWEARPFAHLLVVYLLVTNLCTVRRDLIGLAWTALAAVTLQSVYAIWWWTSIDAAVLTTMRGLTEHAASVHLGAAMIAALAAWLLPWVGPATRLALAAAAVPNAVAFGLAERRSAFIGFSLAIVLLAGVLYVERRRVFRWFVPIVTVVAVAYTLAFWNAPGAIGFPAQALKSVLAPDQLRPEDHTSNLYREIEAINVWFTIRVGPVRGIGFGQPFYRLYAMPDISAFPFWEYMPHHSLLWIWLKTGFVGFVAVIVLMVRTLQLGSRSVLRLDGPAALVALVGVLYVAMYLVFSYVDIAWDPRSMVALGVAFAAAADLVGMPER